MTREEAAKRLEWMIENFNDSSVYLWPDQRQELLKSIALLRGPQPDLDTGLVPCGCGGKVDVAFYPGWHGVPDKYQVDCFNCHVGTRPCQTAEQAKAAWNTAMGWKGGAE